MKPGEERGIRREKMKPGRGKKKEERDQDVNIPQTTMT